MRVITAGHFRHAVGRGEFDERDMEDLLLDLQEQLEESDGLDFHGIDRRRPLPVGEETP
jgi:hypothetical protein